MKIILGCEHSQAVTSEFRKRGHEAYSCDLKDTPGNKKWHIKGDILNYLNEDWDMGIFFPPCTHLAVSGAAWFEEKRKDGRQQESIEFFMKFVDLPYPHGIENPVGIMSTIYRKPDQIIHPYYFGDPEPKATCLWLFGLPKLVHFRARTLFDEQTHVEPEYIYTKKGTRYSRIHYLGGGSGEERSIFYPGISTAMAEQWSKVLI